MSDANAVRRLWFAPRTSMRMMMQHLENGTVGSGLAW
jgi:hypothetical protein